MAPEPMGGKNMKNYAHAAKAKKGKEERKRMRRKIKGEKEREIANLKKRATLETNNSKGEKI